MRLINRQPDRFVGFLLALLPFVLVLVAYALGSAARLAENPSDKLLPAPSQIVSTAISLLTEPDRRSGEIVFWTAILPILFIVFGLGETSKVALIVIGTAPFLIRDVAQRVMEIPQELIIKAQTLGASTGVIALRVALPQTMPRLIQAVRLALGPAWLYLIAAEAIASESGLGYRIFLVRRYLAMDVILTYVLWITLLAFLADWALRTLARRLYPWAGAAAG